MLYAALSLVARGARGSYRDADLDARPAGARPPGGKVTVQLPSSSCSVPSRRRRSSGSATSLWTGTPPAPSLFIEELVGAGPGPRPTGHRPARAPAPPAARPPPRRGARLAASSPRRPESGCARQANQLPRGDRPETDRPARRRRGRHAPGRRPAPPARARAGQGDAPRLPTCRASRPALPARAARAEALRGKPAASPWAGLPKCAGRLCSPDSRYRPSRLSGGARAAAGGLAADRSSPRSRSGRSLPPRYWREAHPAAPTVDTLVLEFAASAFVPPASWPRSPSTRRCSKEALYEITGRRLALAFAVGEKRRRSKRSARSTGPPSEDELVRAGGRRRSTPATWRGGLNVSGRGTSSKLMQQAQQVQEEMAAGAGRARRPDRGGVGRRRHGHRQRCPAPLEVKEISHRSRGDRSRRSRAAGRHDPRRGQRGVSAGPGPMVESRMSGMLGGRLKGMGLPGAVT